MACAVDKNSILLGHLNVSSHSGLFRDRLSLQPLFDGSNLLPPDASARSASHFVSRCSYRPASACIFNASADRELMMVASDTSIGDWRLKFAGESSR